MGGTCGLFVQRVLTPFSRLFSYKRQHTLTLLSFQILDSPRRRRVIIRIESSLFLTHRYVMRTTPFANDQYYHVFNRGVDHRNIFNDRVDFWRFYLSLYFFNDQSFVNLGGKSTFASLRDENSIKDFLKFQKPKKPFVEIISFILLPNHFHMLVRQIADNGVSDFLHRVSMGFSHYFNKRYERTGCLFESKFKAILLTREAHLFHLPRYIHLNALDVCGMSWRDGSVANWDKAVEYLDTYPWSSHHVYMGRSQILPIVQIRSTEQLFPSPARYIYFLKQWGTRSPAQLMKLRHRVAI